MAPKSEKNVLNAPIIAVLPMCTAIAEHIVNDGPNGIIPQTFQRPFLIGTQRDELSEQERIITSFRHEGAEVNLHVYTKTNPMGGHTTILKVIAYFQAREEGKVVPTQNSVTLAKEDIEQIQQKRPFVFPFSNMTNLD